jgi:hypothetical protein
MEVIQVLRIDTFKSIRCLKKWGRRFRRQDSKGKEYGLVAGVCSMETDLRVCNKMRTEVFVQVLLN